MDHDVSLVVFHHIYYKNKNIIRKNYRRIYLYFFIIFYVKTRTIIFYFILPELQYALTVEILCGLKEKLETVQFQDQSLTCAVMEER